MSFDRCDRSDLCAELGGATGTEFEAVYGVASKTRVLDESPSTAALVDLSPLTVGHSLVLPRTHLINIGQVLAGSVGADFAMFLELFLDRWRATFGRFVLLEHGSAAGMDTSACISHAHLHVMSADGDAVAELMRRDGLELTPVEGGWRGLDQFGALDVPYFFVGGEDSGAIALDPPRMPSQYLRIVAGATLGYEAGACDWAVVVRRELHELTLSRWAASRNHPGKV